jgi:hypothetical protein
LQQAAKGLLGAAGRFANYWLLRLRQAAKGLLVATGHAFTNEGLLMLAADR